MDKDKIIKAVKDIIVAIGDDPNREGLLHTPQRVAKMYLEIFSGIGKNLQHEVSTQFVAEKHKEMVILREIPFYSVCEHHLIPFVGKAHVAYIPDGKLIGLSKLARVVETASRKPHLQERLTSEIADAINLGLRPKGVLVVVEAEHLCISMRGIKKAGSFTTTSAVRGIFLKNDTTRAEALTLIQR